MNKVRTKSRALAWAVCVPASAAMLMASAGAASAATAAPSVDNTPPWVEAVQVADESAAANNGLSDCIAGGSELFTNAALVGDPVMQDQHALFALDTDKDGKADAVYVQSLDKSGSITDVFGVGASTYDGTFAHVYTVPPTGASTCSTGALISVTPTPNPTTSPTGGSSTSPTGEPTGEPTDSPTVTPTDGATTDSPSTNPTDDPASGGSAGGSGEVDGGSMMEDLSGLDFADASGCGPLGELSAKFVKGVDDGSIVLDESDYSISPDGNTITAVIDVAGDGSPDLRYVFAENSSTVEGDTDNNGSYDSKYVLGEDKCTSINAAVTNAVPTAKTDGANLPQASAWSQAVALVKVVKTAAVSFVSA